MSDVLLSRDTVVSTLRAMAHMCSLTGDKAGGAALALAADSFEDCEPGDATDNHTRPDPADIK